MSSRAVLILPLCCLVCAFPAALGGQRVHPDTIRSAVDKREGEALALFRELLRLPNDAHGAEDILRLVSWLEDAFQARGFAIERLPTEGGSPLLLAERASPGAERTALIYLQADGQPVDPSRWDQPDPYEPVLKTRTGSGEWRPLPWERLAGPERNPEWRIFARSAADSKGPVAQFLSALDVLTARGLEPAVHLKVIVDTEEELGSPHLPAAVERFRDRLAADMLVIFDGPPHASGAPTLKFGARGIALATLTTYGPTVPQHSGHYGNYAPNPAFGLSRVLGSLKDDAGRVLVPGWYDGVDLDAETLAALAAVPDDEQEIQRALGVAMVDSVAPTLQQALQYPSLNVRGLASAWVGREARTVIPASATAELDIRLVRESDPERLLRLLRGHIERLGYAVLEGEPSEEDRRRHPRLATLTSRIAYGAFRTPFDAPEGRWLEGALTHLNGTPPIRIRTSGGSIPISPFVITLGLPAVSVPTVNPDNNQHSPNENLRVGSFVDGIATIVAVLTEPAAF